MTARAAARRGLELDMGDPVSGAEGGGWVERYGRVILRSEAEPEACRPIRECLCCEGGSFSRVTFPKVNLHEKHPEASRCVSADKIKGLLFVCAFGSQTNPRPACPVNPHGHLKFGTDGPHLQLQLQLRTGQQ